MNFISAQLDIHVLKNMDIKTTFLYFKFKGKFTEETSIAGSKAWASFLNERPNEKIEFVWDCEEMTGFEINARKEWYETMKGYKDQIKMVYVISNNLMIRSAAKVMLQFFKIPSEINRSGDQLPKTLQL